MTNVLDTPRILIVEDERTIAGLMKLILSKEGYYVADIVETGKEAVEIALKTHPDLILMDIKLSCKFDGIVACEQIKKSFDIPVIFVSAYADEDMITRANQSKPCGYIVKPFKNAELIEKINAALASNAKSGSGRHTVKKINRHQFYTGDV